FSSFSRVKAVWERFSSLGVQFALDDFGTGYSNLETLVNVPFDIVKIDRKVVSNSKNNFELINMIAVMLDRLGKQVVAEGVETVEQLRFVEAAGIQLVQGFYFSRPVPESQFLDMLTFDSSR
ncbi:MAG TPA: EAL domain-containing protein, partial [Sphaerochaetaceae bacterium]|nr:EAL domain-containing protein [Sphaerochaetaceae bacterium]